MNSIKNIIKRRTFLKKVLLLLFTTKTFAKSKEEDKIAVIYISRTNNTKALAHMINEIVKGELIQIETKLSYPKDYKKMVEQVRYENEIYYLPKIKEIKKLNKYKTIFLGFPTWGMQVPPPIKTFLHNHDFKNKTIIPFNTNAGYGIGNSLDTIKSIVPNTKIYDVFSVKGGIERDEVFFVMKDNYKRKVYKNLKKWISYTSR